MGELRIHTHIHSRYRVLDASGQLPFSIVFGLCRRSPTDIDPRPLLVDIAGSVFDVPSALAHGLLTLHEQGPDDAKKLIGVDLKKLSKIEAKDGECISLPTPVNRTEHWRDTFTVYQWHLDVNGELASVLELGKKYIVKLASEDLGVRRLAYSDRNHFIGNDGQSDDAVEPLKLVNSKPTAGNASFTVVRSLDWPPRVETKMRLCAGPTSPESTPVNAKPISETVLEVSIINTDSDPVTVQTRGHQHFLKPWGPFQPEPDADDRIRIIDASPLKPPMSSLQVIDSATGQVVRGNEKRGTGPLTDSSADKRPKMEDVVTLKPGLSINRIIDIGALLHGLEDGQYSIRIQPRGCRWWHGEIGTPESEDRKIPAHLCGTLIPPLMLESQDEVKLRIRGGKVDQAL